MGKYKIEIKKSAIKELYTIPEKILKKIIDKIKSLSNNPRPVGCIKLSKGKRYRIRQGNYRIIYSIEDDLLIVYIITIKHRKDVYR
jgi:mRNA interferase RelE/StbE